MPTRTRHSPLRAVRRLNPEDWFGYSVADDIKVTVVNTPITAVRDTSGQQKTAMKPYGLWYACGGEWIEWMKQEVPAWLEDGQYLYEVFPKYSTTGLYDYEWGEYAGGVLRLSTKEEVEIFHDLFGAWDHAQWVEVAKIWDGIEICPYQYELRLSSVGWYYTWDVASGCIWRPSGLASPLALLKSRTSASTAPRRGVDTELAQAHGRANPRRNPSTLATLALAGVAGAAGYHAGKRALAKPQPPKKVVPLDEDDGYAELRRLQAERALKGRFEVPFVLPPRKGGTRRNPFPSKEEFEAAKNRFYDALEAEAGEGQTFYFGPFVVIGDQTGNILGKLELDVWQGMPDGGLAVSLSYIGVNRDQRQQGRGTRLMQIVLAAADAAGLPVTLTVSPQKERGDARPPMNKKQLRAFYEKFGFVPVKGMVDRMVRAAPVRVNSRRR